MLLVLLGYRCDARDEIALPEKVKRQGEEGLGSKARLESPMYLAGIREFGF